MAHAPKFLALVNEAKKRVKETNVADVKRRLDAGEKLVLVDVREESEWGRGHLPEPCTSEKASSNAILSNVCRTPIPS